MVEAYCRLKKIDKDLKKVINDFGFPRDRSEPNTFKTLAKIIIGQQISRSAAKSITKKLSKNGLFNIKKIISTSEENLKIFGLSLQKSRYIKNLAEKLNSKEIILKKLYSMEPEEIESQLMDLYGVGKWTVNNYRLFALGDPDAWPESDLVLLNTIKKIKNINVKVTAKELNKISLTWKPFRGAAALILWHYNSKTN